MVDRVYPSLPSYPYQNPPCVAQVVALDKLLDVCVVDGDEMYSAKAALNRSGQIEAFYRIENLALVAFELPTGATVSLGSCAVAAGASEPCPEPETSVIPCATCN